MPVVIGRFAALTAMAKTLGIDAAVVRLLMDVSILCSQNDRHDQARDIARALARFRDDLPQPRTVVAASLLWQGRAQEAADELQATLARFPHHQLAKAFLGAAHQQLGRPDGERLLKEVVDDGRDEWAIRFAREALGYAYRGAAPAATVSGAVLPAAVSSSPAARPRPMRSIAG